MCIRDRDISNLLIENYGSRVRIFENSIPMSVRAAEISAEGVSIYKMCIRDRSMRLITGNCMPYLEEQTNVKSQIDGNEE